MQSVTEILEDETLTMSERVEKVFIEAPARQVEEVKEAVKAQVAEGLTKMLDQGNFGFAVSNAKMGADGTTLTCTVEVLAPVAYVVMDLNLPAEPEESSNTHCMPVNLERLEVTNPWSGAVLPADAAWNAAWMAAATSVNVPTLATEVEPAGIAAIAAQFSSGAEKLPMDMQWALGRCDITPIAGEKLTAQDELYMKVVRRDQEEVNRRMAERLGVVQLMLDTGMVSEKTARKELGIQTDEDIEEMDEEQERAWRAAVMANESLTMAERVERVMMGRPKLPGSAEKIVGAMAGFSKRLADEKKVADRFDEEERARVPKEQTKG